MVIVERGMDLSVTHDGIIYQISITTKVLAYMYIMIHTSRGFTWCGIGCKVWLSCYKVFYVIGFVMLQGSTI